MRYAKHSAGLALDSADGDLDAGGWMQYSTRSPCQDAATVSGAGGAFTATATGVVADGFDCCCNDITAATIVGYH